MNEAAERTIGDVVQEAIRVWIEATGMDPEKEWSYGQTYSDAERIGRAQEMEDDALTAFMLIRESTRRHAGQVSHTTLELLEEPDRVQVEIDAYRRLLKIVDDPVALGAVEEFQEALRQGCRQAGLGDALDEQIADVEELAHIRNDALVSRDILNVHTFRRGAGADKRLKYNEKLLKFWNIQSVVQAAMVQPEDAISMVMIRDPVAMWSFFVFLVKDGENIVIWTDAEQQAHPLEKFMSRSRGQARRFATRAGKLRFPYEKFNFEFDDEGKHFIRANSTALVPINVEGVAVGRLKELPPDQALWAMMMFTFIAEHKTHPDELSYTGSGTVGQSDAPGCRALPLLTHKDVAKDKLNDMGVANPGDEEDDDDEWEDRKRRRGRAPTGQKDWLEKRYQDQVPENIFNLVGDDEDNLYLTDGTKYKPPKLLTDGQKEGKPRSEDSYDAHQYGLLVPLEGVQPTAFGTAEEMKEDRLWLARYNKAKWIGKLADDEYEERKDEIFEWFKERVLANSEALIDAAARGKLTTSRAVVHETFGSKEVDKERNMVQQAIKRNGDPFSWWRRGGGHVRLLTDDPGERVWTRGGNYRLKGYGPKCFISLQAVSVWTEFTPKTAACLAVLVNCTEVELPDVLQHWTHADRYHGNSILDRLDPMDAHLENPWAELKFTVVLGLSKQTFNKLLIKRGLPKRELEDRTKHDDY